MEMAAIVEAERNREPERDKALTAQMRSEHEKRSAAGKAKA